MGCDFRWLNVVRCLNWFQSTHPHGVRQNLRSKVIDVLEFQSTHPHGVRQYNLQQLPTLQAFQSTHPHGVRLFAPEKVKQDAEFQSTHPHGVRLSVSGCALIINSFNPHTHMGCDGFPFSLLSFLLRFNPRTHMGCDH